MSEEIDHWATDEIVCPYCGYEYVDSWEFEKGDDGGVLNCKKCGEDFRFFREYSITYSTRKTGEE